MNDTVTGASSMVRLTFLVQNLYAEVGQGCGLTVAQSLLLCSLNERTVGMAELSSTLGLERSSLTGLVDRAEQRGLVARESDPLDRRAVNVALTPAGVEAGHRFHDQLSVRLNEVLSDLSATDRVHFTRVIGQLVSDVPAVFAD
jgi:DNA-binding MarR family transcriptional regulator